MDWQAKRWAGKKECKGKQTGRQAVIVIFIIIIGLLNNIINSVFHYYHYLRYTPVYLKCCLLQVIAIFLFICQTVASVDLVSVGFSQRHEFSLRSQWSFPRVVTAAVVVFPVVVCLSSEVDLTVRPRLYLSCGNG